MHVGGMPSLGWWTTSEIYSVRGELQYYHHHDMNMNCRDQKFQLGRVLQIHTRIIIPSKNMYMYLYI